MYQQVKIDTSTCHTYWRLPERILRWWSQWWIKPMTKLYDFLGRYCQHTEVRYYKTITISYDTLLDKIMDICDNVYCTGFERPEYLFIGRDYFDDLLGHIDIRYVMSFQINASGFKELYGMNIIIVPWITGCFCMPKMENWR